VEFVVVGGMAAVFHGSRFVTEDLDVCARLDSANMARILAALRDIHPCYRMRPDRMPLPDDPSKLAGFRNLYLKTEEGQLDILGEITGVGGYEEAARRSVVVDLGPERCRILDIAALIASKRAMGRPRDLQAAAELEAIHRRLGENREPRPK